MFKQAIKTVVAGVVLASAAVAQASILNVPVPTNAYITQGGLDWAWASPVPADGSGGFGVQVDLSYQGQFGWRLPTAAELAFAPNATDFMFQGANVPFGGFGVDGASFQATNGSLTGDAACASPYFNNTYSHCDWQDGNGQPLGPWFGIAGAPSFADSLVVRAVPEPEAYGLLLAGLGVAAAAGLRRRKAA